MNDKEATSLNTASLIKEGMEALSIWTLAENIARFVVDKNTPPLESNEAEIRDMEAKYREACTALIQNTAIDRRLVNKTRQEKKGKTGGSKK